MCQTCRDSRHLKIKNAAEHKVIDIKDVGKPSDEPHFSLLQCNLHSEQCCMFCEICEVLVCLDCMREFHGDHELVDIKEGYEIKRQELLRKLQEVRTGENDLKMKVVFIETKMVTTDDGFTKLQEELADNHEKLKKEICKRIDKHFGDLQVQVDQDRSLAKESFNNDLEEMEKFREKRDNMKKELEEMVYSNDATKFFENVENLSKSITPLEPKFEAIELPSFIPGEINQDNDGKLWDGRGSNPVYSVKVKYQTGLAAVGGINKRIWLCYGKSEQKVKVKEGNLKVLLTFDQKVYNMAFTSENELLLCTGSTILKINKDSKVEDTAFNTVPFFPGSIYITTNNKVMVGGRHNSQERAAVIVMDQMGVTLVVYEHDKNNQPLFRNPNSLTTTSDGHLFVVNFLSKGGKCQVIALQENGDVIT